MVANVVHRFATHRAAAASMSVAVVVIVGAVACTNGSGPNVTTSLDGSSSTSGGSGAGGSNGGRAGASGGTLGNSSGGTPSSGGVTSGGAGGGAAGASAGGTTGGGGATGAIDSGTPLSTHAFVFVGSGSYGGPGTISLFDLDISARTLVPKGSATVGKLQSFLAWDQPHRLLFAADEADGMLRKVTVDAATWALGTPVEIQTAGHPVYVTASKDGSVALVAHYNEGSVQSFPVTSGGFAAAASSDSPGAQAHAIVLSEDERFAFAPCKGSDLIARYSFDGASGKLTALAPPVKTQANDGPRHLAWTPDGKEAFVVDEISSTVIAYSYDGNGALAQIDRITTLASGSSGTNTAAEILVHPSGKFVYATNRVAGKDGDVVAFRIGTDGHLTVIGHQTTGGPTPRSAALDPTGRVLLAGNQDATTVALFSVDGQTGALSAANMVDVGKGPYFVGAAQLPE